MPVQYLRVRPQDYERFGKLIMTWSTGLDYLSVDPGGDLHNPALKPATIPQAPATMTRQAFLDTCQALGIVVDVPTTITTIAFVKNGVDTVVLKIPDPEMIREMNQKVFRSNVYPAPSPNFLDAFYNAATHPKPHSVEEVQTFTAQYLAEYTLKLCG